MIAIVSPESEFAAVTEFFQLFKTASEHYIPGKDYELAIVTTKDVPSDLDAKVLVVYNSEITSLDGQLGIHVRPPASSWFEFEVAGFPSSDLPIYGQTASFPGVRLSFLRRKGESETAAYEVIDSSRRLIRIGYDLFSEVSFLLSQGQPSENALIPTLDLHISILREILVRCGVPFAEVLPAPARCDFMVCLTHDVDFTGIREHTFDSTMFGFLYRSTLGSLKSALKGTTSWSKCWTNWRAALSLPFVQLGLMPDFWLEFDRYCEIEKDLGSTFFFIPFRKYPGRRDAFSEKPASQRRAAKYDIVKLKQAIFELENNGSEVGLHGIDAWEDVESARRECNILSTLTGQDKIGVRMHWLYFGSKTPEVLEAAQLLYDSTFGYNDAVGFRAGTAQVFCIAPSKSLMELPLVVQDTALFYPDRMNLTEKDAMNYCDTIVEHLSKAGGVLTVNWHTRSLSPERLWGDFYKDFIFSLQKSRVWFGTARETVNWFNSRRKIEFDELQSPAGLLRMKLSISDRSENPSFTIRVYNDSSDCNGPGSGDRYHEISWEGETELTLTFSRAARV
jgi:hypothetical protein